MKRTCLFVVASLVALLANAAAPNNSGTYYQNANGKKGAQLKTALCGILWETRYNPALSYNELWTAFHTTDVRSDGKIWDMYSDNTNYEPGGSAQGHNYSGEGDSYNREHSFPASWFGSNTPMYTDLHHIYPTDGYINNRRSNYPFGETNGNTYKSHNSFSKLGSCTVSGYTGTVFEPADKYKGDFARTYFYMVTCYEEKLADWYSKNSESRATIDGSAYPGFQTWQLNMLLKWAMDDPVSDKEIARNTAVKNLQGNRNPFIDYPGLEQYIWGSCKDTEFSYNNYVQPTTWSTEYNSSSGSGSGGSGGGQGGSGTGEDKTITLTYNSFGLTNSYAVKTATVDGYGFTINKGYLGSGNSIQMNSSQGSGILYNTTAIPGLKSITVNVASGDKTYTITTGTSQNPTANSQTGTTGGTYNAADGDTYFQLKVSGGSYFSSIVITYNEGGSSTTIDPTFNNLTDLSVNWNSTLTLTSGTTGTPNFLTDGTVTLTSLNENVVIVDGLTITPVAVGTALITVNTGATTAYNAGTDMFPITVNAPEGKTTAKPSESGLLFRETFGDNSGSARNWSDSYSVKSGVSAVYSGASYTVTNAKQSKNTMGQTASALVSGSGTVGTFIVGPLNVAGYSNLTASNYFGMSSGSWSSNSYMKLYYSTSTASNRTYAEVSRTDNNTPSKAVSSNSNYVQATYNLPQAAQSSTLYLKFEFYCYQTNSNSQAIGQAYLDGVSLSGSSAATESVTLNTSGYATFCSQYPLDFSDYETADYSAWQVTGVNGTTITFEQVTGSVKGGTGLLLKGDPGAIVTLTSAASSNELSSNLLYGTLAPTYADTDAYYGLSGNTFVKVNAGTVPAGKALLPASSIAGDEVKAFSFVFEDDDATGIDSLTPALSSREGAIYNVAGQRLNKMQKGINIVNGKKILK